MTTQSQQVYTPGVMPYEAWRISYQSSEAAARAAYLLYSNLLMAPAGFPAGLHPDTADLVRRFSIALAEKLKAAQDKYGRTNIWMNDAWLDECRKQLLEHVAKGDPRDVAAYCAFLWHHSSHTSSPHNNDAVRGLAMALASSLEWALSTMDHTDWASDESMSPALEKFTEAKALVAQTIASMKGYEHG